MLILVSWLPSSSLKVPKKKKKKKICVMWSNLWHVSLPLMHWWLLQNSWFFMCDVLYDFGSLWVSFQDCPLACRLPSHFLVNFLLKASHAYFSFLYLSWDLLANILAASFLYTIRNPHFYCQSYWIHLHNMHSICSCFPCPSSSQE